MTAMSNAMARRFAIIRGDASSFDAIRPNGGNAPRKGGSKPAQGKRSVALGTNAENNLHPEKVQVDRDFTPRSLPKNL